MQCGGGCQGWAGQGAGTAAAPIAGPGTAMAPFTAPNPIQGWLGRDADGAFNDPGTAVVPFAAPSPIQGWNGTGIGGDIPGLAH